MRRTITRHADGEWCEIEIKLRDGRLSICGSAGYVLTPAQARREAHEMNASLYDELSDDERRDFNRRLRCRSANGFARRIAECDGEYAGIDVHGELDDGRVLVTTSCGQIREELQKWFPEAADLYPWHLNDMRADCEHQEAAVAGGRERYECGDVCEVCGYRYGSAWLKRDLPAEIVALAETVCQDG